MARSELLVQSEQSNDAAFAATPAATQLLGAWCALLARRSDSEALAIDVLACRQSRWQAQRVAIQVNLQGTVSGFVAAAGRALASAGEASVAGAATAHCAGFGYVDAALLDDGSIEHLTKSGALDALDADLHLLCATTKSELRCVLLHRNSAVSADAAASLVSHYRTLLGSFEEPDALVSTLPLLTKRQESEQRRQWAGPSIDFPFESIFETIDRQAQNNPGAIAVVLEDEQQTYGELKQRTDRFAAWLRQRGLKRGDCVAMCLGPHIDVLTCILGTLKAGGTYVPLEPSYPAERLAIMLGETRPLVVVCDTEAAERVLAVEGANVVTLDTLQRELTATSESPTAAPVSPDDTAYIVYTSGTTGRPKGVRVTHGNLSHYITVARNAYGYHPGDVIPALARFTFSITFFELLSPLAAGAQLVLLPRGRVLDMAAMCSTLREVTCIHASPSLWRKMIAFIDAQKLGRESFANLRHVSSGGDMVPPDVLESLKRIFPKAEVFVIYGSSEISCMGCTFPVPRDRTLTSTRVGKPFPNMAVRLLDSGGNLVPPGVLGEVCFAGDGVAKGYLNLPEHTAQQFRTQHGERLYRTGDVGRFDANGDLELVGRSDFQIKLRGFRIEPAEVEAVLRTLEGIRDAVVCAPVQDDGERLLVAYVVVDPARPPSAKAIRAHLKSRLPDYMIPADLIALESLPVNTNLKVDRLALIRSPPQGKRLLSEAVPPRNARERQLLAIWERLLGISGIGVEDEYFDVGGDSLRAVVLMSEIDKQLGVAIPVSTLLTHPTVAALARWMDGKDDIEAESASVICLAQGDNSQPAIFLVHDGDGETIPYRNLARALGPGRTVYGLRPKSTRHHPILHTRFSEMVDFYVEQIRKHQASGPYFVGGLCIGGFLSFEVARKLREQGHQVGPVFLIDVAHVTTPAKSTAARRFARLSSSVNAARGANRRPELLAMAKLLVMRVRNVVVYEARTRFMRNVGRAKIRALRLALDRNLALPDVLRDIPVDPVLRHAEREYVVPEKYPGEIVLFRATSRHPALDGIVDDTPYIELFEDSMLGWEGKAASLVSYDLLAGHSSMLREPYAHQIAQIIERHVAAVLDVKRDAPKSPVALAPQ
ncbi:MAG TPA: amino acid adenylation domain-containing protein [Polyangiaceae bacterium]|nr:amino acid adenylation domain-containing protein [Polyangiaceae bacterium]